MSILTLLNTDEFKKTLVKALNDNIDIPVIHEGLEEKIFTAIIETLVAVVSNMSQ